MNTNLSKKFFNYYLRAQKHNALNHTIKGLKPLNLANIPEFNIPATSKFQHYDNFSFSTNFAQTFTNQTIACLINESLITDKNDILPEAKELAKYYSQDIKVGAYTESNGHLKLRENFKKTLEKKDINDISTKNMFFTNGSISALDHVLSVLCNKHDQILVPNPFYPFMLNLARSKNLINLEYKLNDEDWSINYENLKNTYNANKNLLPIKSLIISNPHEPTGKLFSRKEIEKVILFCYENSLNLISWEVGFNSYLEESSKNKYIPTMKVLQDMGGQISKEVTLFSIYGLTRGLPNMSSLRTGLIITNNLDPFVHEQLTKYKSIDLCSSVVSQIGFDIIHSQNYEHLFGKEFADKYDKSIKEVKSKLISTKNKIMNQITTNDHLYAHDIECGNSIFTKLNYLNSNIFIQKYYSDSGAHENVVSPGSMYGTNRDDYINIIINPNFDYSFLNI